MTLKYHYSPNSDTWTRCVAQSQDACPFGGEDHADRTSIAREHHGGIMQDSQARESTVTPVVAGVYAVFTGEDKARTYTDKGKLIPASSRAKCFKKVIAPRLLDGQSAKAEEGDLNATLTERLAQLTLPPIEFNERTDEVVIRRSAPVPAGPLAPAPTSSGTVPIGANASAGITPSQSAKATAQQLARQKKLRTQRRRKAIRSCRRAIRTFKSYNRQLNKVAKVGGGSSSKGSSEFLDGFLDWFLDLFELD